MNMDVVDMKDFGSQTQCFKSNEQLRVMDDMNDSGSYELMPQDAMNCSRLWMI